MIMELEFWIALVLLAPFWVAWALLIVRVVTTVKFGNEALPKINMSVLSTAEEQRRKATCDHDWRDCKGVVFDYIRVDARCGSCGTYLSRPTRSVRGWWRGVVNRLILWWR